MSKSEKKDPSQWKEKLTPEQYRITREAGTEAPFSGTFYAHKAKGQYLCICCGAVLFDSNAKYDSGSGWPSYWQPANEHAISCHQDASHDMVRVEVRCGQCDAHLGHLFEDGPEPTGQRYCINSAALGFQDEQT